MFNTPGLTQNRTSTVRPTVVVVQTLAQHSAESDVIDASQVEHAMRNSVSVVRAARVRIVNMLNSGHVDTFSVF